MFGSISLKGLAQGNRLPAQVERAAVLARRGELDEALKLYQQILTERPELVAERLAAAAILEQLARYPEAIDELDRVLAADPAHAEALTRRERVAERAGNGGAALATWSRLIERFPNTPDYRIRRELLRLRVGDERKACDEMARLARQHPQFGEAALQAGHATRFLERHADALRWFTTASQVHTDRGRATYEAARELFWLDRFGDALQHLSRLPAGFADEPAVKTLRILALARRDAEAAARALRTWLDDEKRVDVLLGAAETALKLGLHADAIVRLEAAARPAAGGDVTWLALTLVRAHLQAGAPDPALAVLQRLDVEALGGEDLQEFLQRCIELDQPEAARRALAKLAAPAPQAQLRRNLELVDQFGEPERLHPLLETEKSSWLQAPPTDRAMLAAREGRMDLAARAIDEHVRDNPEFPADRWRARALHAAGDFPRAVDTLTARMQASGPAALGDVRLWIRAQIDAERVAEAWKILHRFEGEFGPRDLVEERADLLRLDLRFEEELDCLRTAVKRDPLDETFACRLADALMDREALDEARQLIDRWTALRPAAVVWMYKQMHWQALRHADWQAALDTLPPLASRASPRTRIDLALNRVHLLMRMGRHEDADRELDAFRERIPHLMVPTRVRHELEMNVAHTMTWLGRHAEARPIFDRLLAAPMSTRLRDELSRLVAANEAFGGGDVERFLAHRHRISNPRHHLRVTDFAPASGAAPPLRVLVLLHLFHVDLWPELRALLANLEGTSYQLCVGLRADQNDDAVLQDVRAFAPTVRFQRVENRGFDVGSHWQALDSIDLSAFDVAMLLQTKKSRHNRVGPAWRRNLMQALMGTPGRWHDNLRTFAEQPQVGMIAAALHQSSFHPWHYPEMRDVLQALEMPTEFDMLKGVHEFATGTMFLIRAGLLAEIHAKTRRRLAFPAYPELNAYKRLDNSHAHAMERAFGMYTRWRGCEILWRA